MYISTTVVDAVTLNYTIKPNLPDIPISQDTTGAPSVPLTVIIVGLFFGLCIFIDMIRSCRELFKREKSTIYSIKQEDEKATGSQMCVLA